MIRIISGIYGCRDENGILVAKSPKDSPFTLSSVEETRLVARGVAEFIGENTIEFAEASLLYNKDMKRKELDKIAESLGLSTAHMNSKTEVIAAIEQSRSDQSPPTEKSDGDDIEDDEEQQPDLNIADTVVKV